MFKDPNKNLNPDRVFEFEVIEGRKPEDSKGQVDSRLFKGGNKLHAILGPDALYTLKYDQGAIPPALQQRFTSMRKLLEVVEPYFEKRGLRIKRLVNAE